MCAIKKKKSPLPPQHTTLQFPLLGTTNLNSFLKQLNLICSPLTKIISIQSKTKQHPHLGIHPKAQAKNPTRNPTIQISAF